MTPGAYIRARREAAGKTLQKVADEIGFSVPYLSDVERGRRYVPRSRSAREALCEAIGAELGEVDRLEARDEGVINVRDLTPSDRERVFALVLQLRAAKVAA